MKTIGSEYTFDYPKQFVTLPEYTAHRGQKVTVVGMVDDVDPECERMFSIQASDGWKGEAFESELV